MSLNYENYVDQAEAIIKKISDGGKKSWNLPSTSQIRNILESSQKIYERARRKQGDLSSEELADVQALRVRLVYDSGRERKVENFVKEANLLDYLKNIGKDRDKLTLLCKYLEALVAYHKFYGGGE